MKAKTNPRNSMIKRAVFVLIAAIGCLWLAAYLFSYGAITSAPFFGETPTESEERIATLCYLGALFCVSLIPAAYILSKKLFK